MTTLTDTAPLDVDLDAQVPCQTKVVDCTRPADWVTHLGCCGRIDTVCEMHRADGHRRWHEVEAVVGGVQCARCDAFPMPHPTWRPL